MRAFSSRTPRLTITNHNFTNSMKAFNSYSLAIKDASSPHKSLQLFSNFHRRSLKFDSFSILFTLKSASLLQNFSTTQHLHAHVVKIGFTSHVYVATSLLYAYVTSSFDHACQLFDEMPVRNTVTWNTMVTGYSKFGDIDAATAVFDAIPSRDLASWSAMIAGYVDNGYRDRGLMVFREMMVNEGLKPDQVMMGSILSGCANMGSLGLLVGKSVHGFTAKNGWELNEKLGTVLVDMYGKCGSLKNASRVFEMMEKRNVMSWTALICGSAQHGHGREALMIFDMMEEAGVKPNELTFTGILNACVQVGLVEEGMKYFQMIEEYGLELRIQHYGCMVDLLGKAGKLEEAYDIINTMKLEPNVFVWCTFLSACKLHKQFDIAERGIERVFRMVKPEKDGGVYTLISDLYVLNEKWDDAERVRKLMMNQNVKKARGASFIC